MDKHGIEGRTPPSRLDSLRQWSGEEVRHGGRSRGGKGAQCLRPPHPVGENLRNDFVTIFSQRLAFEEFLWRVRQAGNNNGVLFSEVLDHVEGANFATAIRWEGQTMADKQDFHADAATGSIPGLTDFQSKPSRKILLHNSRLMSARR